MDNGFLGWLLSYNFSFFAKNTLKYAFGRIWPPFSYKVSAAYFNTPRHFNFRFFDANGSFPSGHATMLSCVSLAIILFYRKAAWVLVPFVLLCLAAMLFLNVHYLSDLIAGTYVGCTITLGLYHLQHHLGRYDEAS